MLGKKLSKITKVAIFVILGIAIGLLGETMPEDVKADFTKTVEELWINI